MARFASWRVVRETKGPVPAWAAVLPAAAPVVGSLRTLGIPVAAAYSSSSNIVPDGSPPRLVLQQPFRQQPYTSAEDTSAPARFLASRLFRTPSVFVRLANIQGDVEPGPTKRSAPLLLPSRLRARRHRRLGQRSLRAIRLFLFPGMFPSTCPFPGGHPPLPRKWQVSFH